MPLPPARGDASSFDAKNLFGRSEFDRIVISYTLSIIPDWRRAVETALAALAPEGELHIVDFGRQKRLPGWFGRLLRLWLARFHVTPRDELEEAHAFTRGVSAETPLLEAGMLTALTDAAKVLVKPQGLQHTGLSSFAPPGGA